MSMLSAINARQGPIYPFGLGVPADDALEPIEIDRQLADTAKVSILRIAEAAEKDQGVALEPCWRVLRIAKWGRVSALRTKLEAFLNSREEELVISEAEFKLTDEVLACALQIEEGEEASLKKTLETVGIVIGIAGGLATLIATVF